MWKISIHILSVSKEEKENKGQHGCEQYKTLPEDGKRKLLEHRKKDYKMRKYCFTLIIGNYFNLQHLVHYLQDILKSLNAQCTLKSNECKKCFHKE